MCVVAVLEMTPGREDVRSPSHEEGGDAWEDSQGLLPENPVSQTGAAALGAEGPGGTSAAAAGPAATAAAQATGAGPGEASPFAQVTLTLQSFQALMKP